MPDALDMGRDLLLLLSRNNRLEPVDDVFDRIGREHGGWLASADSATNVRSSPEWRAMRRRRSNGCTPSR